MRKIKDMPSMSNVVAGSQATLNLPLGLTYEQLIISYSGVTLAQMQDIEIVINGKTVQAFQDAQFIDDLNQYYGRGAAADGQLVLYFTRPELDNVIARRLTAIGTKDISTLSLQMDIDAGAAAPVVSVSAVQSAQQPLGSIVKYKRFATSFATSGEQEIDNIPRSGARIAAMHLLKADVSNVEVEVNSVLMYEASKTLSEKLQSDEGRSPVSAKMTTVDFILDGDVSHTLQTAGMNDFRIRPTIDTSGQLPVVVEYIDGFAGI